MEYRPLDLTVISAKDIKDLNLIGKMDVYAVSWLSNDPRHRQKTPVDRDGGKNPSWNFTVRFSIDESAARSQGLVLHILLRCEKPFGDKDVGEVAVPVKELLDNVRSKTAQFISYQVRTPSGKPKGTLNLSYKFGQPIATSAATSQAPPIGQTAPFMKSDAPPVAYPVTAVPYPAPVAYPPPPGQAYPPPPSQAYPPPPTAFPPPPPGAYPPPPTAFPPPPPGAYSPHGAYPPPPGAYPPPYGYPPPPQPYGYPPMAQPQQPPKKNKFGLGLGAGLLGGALGGLLIGDMVSDAAESSYDAGFADGGGFDF